jgi:predicted FMN-binding regulatory protein PaiB
MIFHDYYGEVSAEDLERFVSAQELGRLVTVGEEGIPHIGLYPFVTFDSGFDLHLVRADEQVLDLKARPRCVFELDEVLGVIPSYWVHPQYAGAATAYHRTVIFECTSVVAENPAAVAAQQERLLERYQPEGGFRPLTIGDPLYRGALAQLAAVRLTVGRCRVKFKLGQNRTAEARRRVVDELRRRGRPNDHRAADALEATLGTPAAPPDGRDDPR